MLPLVIYHTSLLHLHVFDAQVLEIDKLKKYPPQRKTIATTIGVAQPVQTDVDAAFKAGALSVTELGFHGIESELLAHSPSATPFSETLIWTNGSEFLQGRAEFTDPPLQRESPYDRLPSAAAAIVDKQLWAESRLSTGMYVM